MNLDLGKPLAASLLLGALLTIGGLTLTAAWADLSSVEAERDAKADFVTRGLGVGRHAAVPGDNAGEARLFVMAGSETLAAARIDALLRSMVSNAGGIVLSSRAEAEHDDTAPGVRIEIQAVVDAPNDALQVILLAMESGAPVMLVDALAIQPVAPGNSDMAETASPRLRAAMTLSAYWKAPDT